MRLSVCPFPPLTLKQCITPFPRAWSLRHVHKDVDVILVSFHVFVFDEPLDLFLDHLLRGQEHVLEDFDELRLKLRVGDLLPHLHDLDDGFLRAEDAKLDDAVIVLLSRSLRGKLQTTDQVDFPAPKTR